MSCFFCSSNEHVSHNCDIHKTDEDRRKILDSKNCCQSCLTQQSSYRISPRNGDTDIACQECEKYRKCYICFSKAHHTVFCSDRFTAPKLCRPNIDKDLLPRFMGMLSTEEKHSLFFSSSIDPEFVKLKPFKVKYEKEISITRHTTFPKTDFLVAEKAKFKDGTRNLLISQIIFRCEHLVLDEGRYSFISKLLSSKTKSLTCNRYAEIDPKLIIIDILENAPNLERIELDKKIADFWGDGLLQLSWAGKLKQETMSYSDLNFNVESLVTLMKEKSATISLSLPAVTPYGRFNVKKVFQKVTNKLSSHFTPNFSKCFPSLTGLFVHIYDEFGCVVSKQYLLKDD